MITIKRPNSMIIFYQEKIKTYKSKNKINTYKEVYLE